MKNRDAVKIVSIMVAKYVMVITFSDTTMSRMRNSDFACSVIAKLQELKLISEHQAEQIVEAIKQSDMTHRSGTANLMAWLYRNNIIGETEMTQAGWFADLVWGTSEKEGLILMLEIEEVSDSQPDKGKGEG